MLDEDQLDPPFDVDCTRPVQLISKEAADAASSVTPAKAKVTKQRSTIKRKKALFPAVKAAFDTATLDGAPITENETPFVTVAMEKVDRAKRLTPFPLPTFTRNDVVDPQPVSSPSASLAPILESIDSAV